MSAPEPALDADAGAPIDTLRMGSTIGGRYSVRSFLGSDGMGAVYLAPDGTIDSSEIVSHVTRHLITNYGDRPRP